MIAYRIDVPVRGYPMTDQVVCRACLDAGRDEDGHGGPRSGAPVRPWSGLRCSGCGRLLAGVVPGATGATVDAL